MSLLILSSPSSPRRPGMGCASCSGCSSKSSGAGMGCPGSKSSGAGMRGLFDDFFGGGGEPPPADDPGADAATGHPSDTSSDSSDSGGGFFHSLATSIFGPDPDRYGACRDYLQGNRSATADGIFNACGVKLTEDGPQGDFPDTVDLVKQYEYQLRNVKAIDARNAEYDAHDAELLDLSDDIAGPDGAFDPTPGGSGGVPGTKPGPVVKPPGVKPTPDTPDTPGGMSIGRVLLGVGVALAAAGTVVVATKKFRRRRAA